MWAGAQKAFPWACVHSAQFTITVAKLLLFLAVLQDFFFWWACFILLFWLCFQRLVARVRSGWLMMYSNLGLIHYVRTDWNTQLALEGLKSEGKSEASRARGVIEPGPFIFPWLRAELLRGTGSYSCPIDSAAQPWVWPPSRCPRLGRAGSSVRAGGGESGWARAWAPRTGDVRGWLRGLALAAERRAPARSTGTEPCVPQPRGDSLSRRDKLEGSWQSQAAERKGLKNVGALLSASMAIALLLVSLI